MGARQQPMNRTFLLPLVLVIFATGCLLDAEDTSSSADFTSVERSARNSCCVDSHHWDRCYPDYSFNTCLFAASYWSSVGCSSQGDSYTVQTYCENGYATIVPVPYAVPVSQSCPSQVPYRGYHEDTIFDACYSASGCTTQGGNVNQGAKRCEFG